MSNSIRGFGDTFWKILRVGAPITAQMLSEYVIVLFNSIFLAKYGLSTFTVF